MHDFMADPRRTQVHVLQKRCLGALLLGLLAGFANGDWTPDKRPDPQRILDEAETDTAAGRYADALAKHVWFHENALKYAPGMYGIRLSFALHAWATLGAAYPPALQKLKAVRDEAGSNVRVAKDARHSFHDFAAINKVLEEDTKTKELFFWLDANNPKVATAVFDIAQPSLVEAKEYGVCGRYLDPDRSFQRMLRLYGETKRIAVDADYQKEMQDSADKSFTNGVATLVALLVVNGRQADADRIAGEARKAWHDQAFRKQLDKAQKGEVPPPWP